MTHHNILTNLSLTKKTLVLTAVLLMIALLFLFGSTNAASPVTQQTLPQQSVLPLEMALQAASTALAACEADGYRVTVAVVDRSGVEKVLLKGDGAGPHTIASSVGKAFTSIGVGGAPGGNLDAACAQAGIDQITAN